MGILPMILSTNSGNRQITRPRSTRSREATQRGLRRQPKWKQMPVVGCPWSVVGQWSVGPSRGVMLTRAPSARFREPPRSPARACLRRRHARAGDDAPAQTDVNLRRRRTPRTVRNPARSEPQIHADDADRSRGTGILPIRVATDAGPSSLSRRDQTDAFAFARRLDVWETSCVRVYRPFGSCRYETSLEDLGPIQYRNGPRSKTPRAEIERNGPFPRA